MDRVDCVVIGAGVVGLASARALALAGREVVVIEAAGQIGSETSSRNSEVIHAGIYYPAGSLKARACVEGRRMIYAYCDEKGVDYRRCGKLIVATNESQTPGILALIEQARRNGVEGISWLSGEQAMGMEPALSCVGAVFSEQTGIIDSHGFMLALQGDLENAGGVIAFESRVIGGDVTFDGIVLDVAGRDGSSQLLANVVINSAGLHAGAFQRALRGFPIEALTKLYYAKGSYFAYSGLSPFDRLIYPAPVQGGLGVHVTFDLGRNLRFGPDVEWIDGIDYSVDPDRGASFYAAVRSYWPGLPDHSIHPAYAGIRPKLSAPGRPAGDFLVQGPQTHGVSGLFNLLGIESPGLTSSLSLAARLAQTVTPDA